MLMDLVKQALETPGIENAAIKEAYKKWLSGERKKKTWSETKTQDEVYSLFVKHLAVKEIRDAGKVWFTCEMCPTQKFGSKQSVCCSNKCTQAKRRRDKKLAAAADSQGLKAEVAASSED